MKGIQLFIDSYYGDDIDLKNATATSRVSKKVRVVPIGQYSLKALKEYIKKDA